MIEIRLYRKLERIVPGVNDRNKTLRIIPGVNDRNKTNSLYSKEREWDRLYSFG